MVDVPLTGVLKFLIEKNKILQKAQVLFRL